VLHACHAYNVESGKVKDHVQEKHHLAYLKVETDYSQGDVEQLRTRLESTLDMIRQ